MDPLAFLGDLALRSTLLLAAALVAVPLLRRASAAERHLVLALAIVALLLLPATILLAPKMTWRIPLPHSFAEPRVVSISATALNSADLVPDSTSLAPVIIAPPNLLSSITLTDGLVALLTIGALIQLGVTAANARFWRQRRRAATAVALSPVVGIRVRAFGGDKLPPVLVSDSIEVPVLLGWLHPAILLPRTALDAEADRLAMMICHELAHLRRGDAWLLPVLALARMMFWWQPLAWLALARLRREREAACDDLVLAGAFRPSDYADLIVDVARCLTARPAVPSGTLAMAMTSPLHDRLAAILDPKLRRRAPSRGILVMAILVAALIGFGLASTQIEASADEAAATANSTTDQPPRRIQLDFRLLSLDETVYQSNKSKIDGMMLWTGNADSAAQVIEEMPSGRLITAPSVLVDDGKKSIAEVVRALPYPISFTKGKDGKLIPAQMRRKFLGPRFETTPKIAADQKTVSLAVHWEVTTLGGWNTWDVPGASQPIFLTRRFSTQSVLISGNGVQTYTRALGNDPIRGDPLASSLEGPTPDAPLKRLIVSVTAKILPPEPKPPLVTYHAKDVLVRVALRLFQISEKTYAAQPAAIDAAIDRGDITGLSKFSDFRLISEPTALAKPDMRATMDAMHNIDPYSFSAGSDGKVPTGPHQPRAVGFRVVEKASIVDRGIDLSLYPELIRFEGTIKTPSGEIQPVFNTRRLALKILMPDGGSHGFWLAKNIPDDAENRISEKTGSASLSSATPVRVGMMVDASLGVQKDQGLFPLPNREKIIQRFNTIVIPKFEMHRADLSDFLQAITIQTKRADPDHVGIGFVLNLPPHPRPLPKVDLDFENASPRQIVDSVAKQTGMIYSIDDYAIYLRPPQTGDAAFSVRTFLVPTGLATEMKNSGVPAPGDGMADAKAALSAHGIKFPSGATAILITSSSKLVVRDTRDQLDAIAMYIESHPK